MYGRAPRWSSTLLFFFDIRGNRAAARGGVSHGTACGNIISYLLITVVFPVLICPSSAAGGTSLDLVELCRAYSTRRGLFLRNYLSQISEVALLDTYLSTRSAARHDRHRVRAAELRGDEQTVGAHVFRAPSRTASSAKEHGNPKLVASNLVRLSEMEGPGHVQGEDHTHTHTACTSYVAYHTLRKPPHTTPAPRLLRYQPYYKPPHHTPQHLP
jgi:hypothetical protein